MKKSYKWTLVVFLALLVVVALALVACTPDNTDDDDVWTIERVYAQAQELGYQGTLDELIAQFKGADGTDGVDGKDGVGIKTMEVNDDGELIVTLTNGTELNLGVVVGATGPQGPQGPQGATGPQGPQGPSGQDGKPSVHTFTVTFVAEGREVGKVVCLDGTTFAPEPAVPQKEYYTGKWESYTLNNVDITVQAVYTPTQYKVTFAGNGQQEVRTYTVETVDEVTAPEVPTKEHYTGAWQGYELQFDNDQVVNAVYTAIEYTATFDDGTKQTTVTYTVENMYNVNIPQVTPKQYYNGSWQQYRFDFSNEQVIRAEYTLIEYKVTFTGNGEQEVRTYTVETVDEVTAPEVPEKQYYTGAWQEYELQFEQNQVVNAVYTPIEYKITFVGNGQRIERTYNAETTSQFVAPEVPVKEQYYGFDYVGAWERFNFEFDDNQEVNAVYTLNTPGYTYTLNEDQHGYSLTKGSNDIEEAHVLPFYNDLPVTSIGTAFYYCTNLQSVTFEGDSQLQTIGDEAFRGCRNLQTITFAGDSQLQSIGLLAFCDCSNLTEITIPNTVTNIGNSAFYYCTNLQSVTFEGDSQLQSIGNSAFYYCTNLQSVTFEGDSQLQSIGNSAFNGCGSLTNVYYGGTIESWCGITFGDGANPMCYADHFFMKQGEDWQEVSGEIEIPESITAIGAYQFYGFKIFSVVIPSNTTKIGAYAFGACDALKEITFADDTHLIGIDSSAFGGCDNLKNIYYGGTVEDWCGITFSSYSYDANPMCYADHFFMKQGDDWQEVSGEIQIPESVEEIGYYQFYGFGNITSITIPSTVTSIGDNAFYNCKALQTATFEGESQLRYIGSGAFNFCEQLTNVYYGGTIESWCGITFGGLYANPMYYADHFSMKQGDDWQEVTKIDIPDGVDKIGDWQFNGFGDITSITIPSTVTNIGDNAFSGCNSLQTLTFDGDSQLQSIGNYAFSVCSNLTSIIIPSTVTSIGNNAFNICSQLTIYCEVANEPNGWDSRWNDNNCPVEWNCCGSTTIGGVVYVLHNDNTATVANTTNELSEQVTIAQNVEFNEKPYVVSKIGSAFYGCSGLTSIIIPSTITSIGNYAFSDCIKLQTVTFEGDSQLQSIGAYAFNSCSSLTSITIPSAVTSIGNYAFSDCTNLETLTFEGDSQLQSIGNEAFSNCWKLTSIIIPSTITSIGNYAFSGCNSLQTVTFEGESQLQSIGDYAFSGCSSLTSITIPSTVTSIGNYAFDNCSQLTIYCEATSEPLGWHTHWNPDNRPVVWDYKNQ